MIFSRVCLMVVTVLLLFAPTSGWAQGQSSPPHVPDQAVQRVATAFSSGDAQSLLENAADRVEVSLFGARTYYSRSQALYVMRDFFKKYAPRRFETGEVAETGKSYFVTGRYWHVREEAPLRVYVRVSTDDDTWYLHEIRIERERR